LPHFLQRRRSLLAAGISLSAVIAATTALLPVVGAQAGAGCAVTYLANTWQGGFSTSITIRNLGEPITGWTLGFAFPDPGQRVLTGWGATWAQSGADVSASSLPFNAGLPAGASTSIGFQGGWATGNSDPVLFTLNGIVCGGPVAPTPTGTIRPSMPPSMPPSPSPSMPPSPSLSPTPSVSPSPGCPPMTSPPDWAARQWPLVLAVEHLDVAAQGQAGFTSFTMSPVDCRVDVYWKGVIPPSVAAVVNLYNGPINVVVHQNSPYSAAELNPLADRLFSDPGLALEAGVNLISSTWPAEGTRLVGGVLRSEPPPDLAAASGILTRRLGVPVELGFDILGGDFGRKDDSAPWYAGGRIFVKKGEDSYEGCTAGWGVKSGDKRYMLTMAHCGRTVGQKVFNGNKARELGPVDDRETTIDSATITVTSAGTKVFTGRPNSGTSIPVEKKTKVVKGEIVFNSSASTGENQDIEVFDPNYRFTDGNGWKIAAAVRAKQKDGKVAGGPGDSGGPVYVPNKDKTKAWAAGVVKGRDKDGKAVDCRNDDDIARGCEDSMLFIPIDPILTHWKVDLLTE
jgi:hypothetical protein